MGNRLNGFRFLRTVGVTALKRGANEIKGKLHHYQTLAFLTSSAPANTVRLIQEFQTFRSRTGQKSRHSAVMHTSTMLEKDSRDPMVLIVEDDEDSRYLMRLELERLGYVVVEAEDGEKAVEVAERESPDIILMDLTLPVMDGIAATQRIRATDGLSVVPVIAVTAHQETDFREGAKAAGFDAYVTKPIDMNWLSELIKGLLV